MSAVHRMSLRLALTLATSAALPSSADSRTPALPAAVPHASEAAATLGLISATITMAFIEVPTRRGLLQDDAARAMAQRVRGGNFCVDGRFRANWPTTPNGSRWPVPAIQDRRGDGVGWCSNPARVPESRPLGLETFSAAVVANPPPIFQLATREP